MKTLLLGIAAAAAALTLPAASANAEMSGGGSGSGWNGHHDGNHDGDHHRRDRRGFHHERFIGGDGQLRGRAPDGAWGYYEGDYDANRSFDSDKWNDWWHERTNRSYPRWVQEAQASGTCNEDRMWWSGAGWHC